MLAGVGTGYIFRRYSSNRPSSSSQGRSRWFLAAGGRWVIWASRAVRLSIHFCVRATFLLRNTRFVTSVLNSGALLQQLVSVRSLTVGAAVLRKGGLLFLGCTWRSTVGVCPPKSEYRPLHRSAHDDAECVFHAACAVDVSEG